MNILFIAHERELNGATRSLLNILSEIQDKHKVYVLTSFKEGPFYDELKNYNVTVVRASFYWWCDVKATSLGWIRKVLKYTIYQRYVNIFTALKLANYVRENNIGIIHSNTSVVNVGALISKYTGIKHVWHIREFADMDFNIYPLVRKKTYYKCMNANTSRFICISKAVANHYYELDLDKKEIVYNGIDSSNFIDLSEKNEQENLNILIAGRVSPPKGQKEAVFACLKLFEEGYHNFKLYIAGSGKPYFKIPEEIKHNVVFMGQVENMPNIRKNMDFELVCSKAEAFGRVTAEAMMGGLPVIGSNTGGTPELIIDGETGFLYNYGDIESLYEKMRIFFDDRMKAKLMGKKAQKYACEKFTINRCVKEILSVYDKC